jgi:hypothetical protein
LSNLDAAQKTESQILLTTAQIAARTGYSQDWFHLKAFAGGGPPYIQLTPRGRRLYDAAKTDEWFRRHTKNSTSDDGSNRTK